MKNMFAFLCLSFVTSFVASLSLAQASSVHPCAPVIQARPTILSCSEGDRVYGIRIDTRMSDVRLCPVKDMIEINTAQVQVTDFEGNIFEEFVLPHGDFTYSLGDMENGSFQSKSRGLNLKNCSSPMPGGFSVGN